MQFQLQVGNTCKEVTREGKPRWAWSLYLDAGEQAKKVQKVVFRLHESFKNPEESVNAASAEGVFQGREHVGWGTFEVGVVIHWHPTAVSRFGKTTEVSHEISFTAAKTVSTFHVSNDSGVTEISKEERTKMGTFAPVAIQVVSLSGEELLSISEGGDMSCTDVVHALEAKSPLLPGHEYKLARGDTSLVDEVKMCDLDASSGELKLNAVVQQKPSMQEDLNMALIEAAGKLDLDSIKTLLAAGASAAFVHDPPGTWGSCDSKSALHVAIQCRARGQGPPSSELDPWKSVIATLLEAKADVNAQRRQSDWRGCGSSSTAFEMVLPAAMQDAALLQVLLAAGANPNTESQRSVHSMRSDGGSRHCVLHTAVDSGNHDVIKTLLDAKADANDSRTEKISNERGYNRDMSETSLHIACKRGDVKTSALLLVHGADINAIRKDLIQENIPEAELVARMPGKTKSKSKSAAMMCGDDPREPGYVCPVRCIPIRETALHIAVQKKHAGLVTLLACAGADVRLPREQGATATSTADLCCGETVLLDATSATWPLSPNCELFAEEELLNVEAAVAASAATAAPVVG